MREDGDVLRKIIDRVSIFGINIGFRQRLRRPMSAELLIVGNLPMLNIVYSRNILLLLFTKLNCSNASLRYLIYSSLLNSGNVGNRYRASYTLETSGPHIPPGDKVFEIVPHV